MTKKSTTTKGGRTGKAEDGEQSIERRVRVILADTERYDYDTRHAVWLALERVRFHSPGGNAEKYMSEAEAHADLPRAERELRELVERVEGGEPVGFVWEDPELKKYADAAWRVLALMQSEGVPDFITDGIYKTLMAAEEVFGVRLWRNEIDSYVESGDWSIDGMAYTFRSHQGRAFEMERKRDLAGLLQAVMTHPDIPDELYNAIADGLSDLTHTGKSKTHDIHHIRWCLSAAPAATNQTLGCLETKGGE